jgi:predicted pyridoxine 5'-phosphate oxidase superfamily flavin-nucleotide-binding protein
VSDDGRALFIPDRHGNNRLDTLRNLLGGGGRIGLLFLIPGFDDAYRVNGRASATVDNALLAQFIEFGKRPRLVVRVEVEEAYIHCPKAFMRARLWKPEAWKSTDGLSSVARRISERSQTEEKPLTVNEAIGALEKEF